MHAKHFFKMLPDFCSRPFSACLLCDGFHLMSHSIKSAIVTRNDFTFFNTPMYCVHRIITTCSMQGFQHVSLNTAQSQIIQVTVKMTSVGNRACVVYMYMYMYILNSKFCQHKPTHVHCTCTFPLKVLCIFTELYFLVSSYID